MIHCLWLISCLLVAGCASPPQQALTNARAAVAQAYAADAAERAPDAYADAAAALRRGEELVQQGDYRAARRVLPRAVRQAQTAEQLVSTARQEQRHQAAAATVREPSPPPAPAPTSPAPAQRATAFPPAEPPPQAKVEPAPRPRSRPEPAAPPAAEYRVGQNETLWSIAGAAGVYGDPLLWPLLYQANRDQIKDPRHIYPGQTLKIPRDLTPAEKTEARAKARTSDIFPAAGLTPSSAAPAR